MITATYHRRYNRLTVTGHAQSGEHGHDLVCASASILVYTLASSVVNMGLAGQVRDPVTNLQEGNAEISCRPVNKYAAPVTLVFDTLCAGYELLARQYPENISYEVRG